MVALGGWRIGRGVWGGWEHGGGSIGRVEHWEGSMGVTALGGIGRGMSLILVALFYKSILTMKFPHCNTSFRSVYIVMSLHCCISSVQFLFLLVLV